jgi:uncharacterized protein (DUF1330 family)
VNDTPSQEPLVLCVLLWAHDGKHDELTAYEDVVLEFVGEHGGEVMQRIRIVAPSDGPNEVQVIRFGSRSDLDQYMADDRRLGLAAQREAVVRRTEAMEAKTLV